MELCTADRQRCLCLRPALAAMWITTMLAQALARQRIGVPKKFLKGTSCHHFSAFNSRTRPQIDNVIGTAHRFIIVLDHDQRVAARLQLFERCEQLLIVARMQPNRRLIENVQDAAQVGTELRSQADALRFAAAERRHAPAKLKVSQSHFAKKFQPLANFRKDVPRNHAFTAFEAQLAK